MNDVVFVMTNSRLNKKKDVRKAKDFNIDDAASNDEWIVENEENSDLNALDEDILVELGEDARGEGVGGAPMDDLEVPPIDDDGDGGDAINEEEDYLHLTLNDLLGLT
ncbi:hypothetical protein GLYMA_18G136551v4 [Glycine max]|nr:hypothetical protein GLYMA_18G136551v4 [Glycine max]KAH1154414.1 hypothetical protein GYH30_049908 [Glycine max]